MRFLPVPFERSRGEVTGGSEKRESLKSGGSGRKGVHGVGSIIVGTARDQNGRRA